MSAMPAKGRIIYLDYLKAFTIFCVILGHSIQSMPSAKVLDGLYSFIYSFHMPLFMTISGMFIGSLLKQPLWKTALAKAHNLLLPVLTFTLTVFVLDAMSLVDFTGGDDFFSYLSGGDMWFLKYLFACIMMACLSKLIFRNTIVAALVPMIILLSVSRVGLVRIYPYLWLGYMFMHLDDVMGRKNKYVLAVSAISFIVCLIFWDVEYDYPHYRWITIKDGISFDNHSLLIVLFRFFIGAVGSLTFITLFRAIFADVHNTSSIFSRIGKRTLGIYCLQIYLLEKTLDRIAVPEMGQACAIFFVLGIALVELFVCDAVVSLLERNKWVACMYLGKRISKEPGG